MSDILRRKKTASRFAVGGPVKFVTLLGGAAEL